MTTAHAMVSLFGPIGAFFCACGLILRAARD